MSNQNTDGLESAMGHPQLCDKGCGFFRNGGSHYCSKCAKEVASEEENRRATERATADSATSIAASLQASQACTATGAPSTAQPVAVSPVASFATPAAAAAAVPDSIALTKPATEGEPQSSNCTAAAAAAAPNAPPNPNRCFQCKKRTGLTGFKCRCGNNFCSGHRLAESHECSFDYKTVQRAQLAEANPVIQAAKVQKI